MLARDPATAQTFLLAPDAPGGTDPAATRVHFLTAVRDWTASDDGVSYGHLVTAATTQLRDHDGEGSVGYRSAQIAALYLHELPATVPTGLQPATGRVIAAYINDVQRSQASSEQAGGIYGEDDAHLPGPRAYGATLDWRDTNRALRAVMGNDEAFRSVTAAQQALTQQELAHTAEAVRRAPPGPVRIDALESWRGAIDGNALLWGATMDAANLAHIDDGQAADARAQALQDLAAAATSIIPIPGGKAVEFAFGQAHDHVFSQAPAHHEADERQDANYTVRLTGRAVRDMMTTSAAAHHLLDPGAALNQHQPREPPGSSDSFLRLDGTLIPRDQMTVHQQNVYEAWLVDAFIPERIQISTQIRKGMEDYR
jgi:hypothetical protein